MKSLFDLTQGETGIIVKVKGRGAFRKRIIEMGFVVGKKVSVIKKAPLQDPVEYKIMGYDISLRAHESKMIDVIYEHEPGRIEQNGYHGTMEGETHKHGHMHRAHKHGHKHRESKHHHIRKDKIINVALVGNPNSGKTSLFNFASNSKEHVGNYTGVTVSAKEARFYQNGYQFNIVDLPGTYSITHYTPEELYVRNYIFEQFPDIVINVIDSSNLERNLFLTTQLIDMDVKVVMALNMWDELTKRGDSFDYHLLGKMIGIPMVPTVGKRGQGIKELFDTIIDAFEDRNKIVRHIHINYGSYIEDAINKIQTEIKQKENYHLTDLISSRFLAIKLLENDNKTKERIVNCNNAVKINHTTKKAQQTLRKTYKEDPETLIADAKYAYISGALKETLKLGRSRKWENVHIIDAFLTNKIFAFPLFLGFMWLMFYTTFRLGEYPMNWIDAGVALISEFLGTNMPDGMLKDLLIDGIIGGVGGVIVFLPNILILFFFISLMEDTGYMARVAFIMDKLMHKIGLHGRSFIPMLMGFGCNVPAIMATRTIENRNDRLLTMLINPFMSCSARLPVYILIIGAFFPSNAGTVLFSIYGFGIVVAILVAILFKKTIFKSVESPFVMELPPYRIPTLRNTIKHMWFKGKQYLQKMGGIILIGSIIIWAAGYFPRDISFSQNYDSQIQNAQEQYDNAIILTPGLNKTDQQNLKHNFQSKIHTIEIAKESERQAASYIGKLGKFIEPVIAPLGFDWKMGVALVAGAAAKEIVVSTIGVLYQADSEAESEVLTMRLRNAKYEDGKKKGEPVFSPLVAFSFLIFVLIYFPCIAVVAAVKRESGSWKWAGFLVVYSTALAWGLSFIVFQIGSLIL
ncbi:MAG: ferrous iron transport protein B [Bacteroidales bacterium]|jgi:ferrous iron transport protein B|nr:ferrous iron transport protein B [Bacteroidales bacterium]